MWYTVPLATGEPFFGAAGFLKGVALEMIREQIGQATAVGVHFDHPAHPHFNQPPQALRRKTGSQPRFTSFAQVPLRASRIGPPPLRHTKAESTGSGTEPRAMPPRRVHDKRRTGQQFWPGRLAEVQRNSAHPRATAGAWVGWKETTTRASRKRLVFGEAREAWRPMGFRAPGPSAAA